MKNIKIKFSLISFLLLTVILLLPVFAAEKIENNKNTNKPFFIERNSRKASTKVADQRNAAELEKIIGKNRAIFKAGMNSRRSDCEWVDLVPQRNYPGSRINFGMIDDQKYKRIFIFGGFSDRFYPKYSNDLWVFYLDSQRWERIEPAGEKPLPRRSCEIAYDNRHNVLYLFGGKSANSDDVSILLNDLWKCDISNNTWSKIDSGSLTCPSPREGPFVFVFNEDSQEIILFGGIDGSNIINDKIWIFSIDSLSWREEESGFPPGYLINYGYTYEKQENKVYLFGGLDRNHTKSNKMSNKLWEFDCNTLQWLLKSDTAPIRRDNNSVAYDKNENEFYTLGGRDQDGHYQNDIYCYNFNTNIWEECLTSPEKPLTILGYKACFLPYSNEIFVFGDLFPWLFSLSDQQWSSINVATNFPYPEGLFSSMIYNTMNQKYYLFGGYYGLEYYNKLWEYDTIQKGWRELAVAGDLPEPARGGMSTVYDPVNNQIILFGGFHVFYPTFEVFNDTYAISLDGVPPYVCRKINTSSVLPSPRRFATAIYHPLRHSMVIFGGDCFSPGLNELWEFDIQAGTWQELTSTVKPPLRNGSTMLIFSSFTNELILFGGCRGFYPDYTLLNDLWKYSFENGEWSESVISGVWPEPRSGCGFAFDSFKNKMLIYGGYYGYDGMDMLICDDVWSYDVVTSQWEELPVSSEHIFREGSVGMFDPQNNYFVIHGGYGIPRLNDTVALALPDADFIYKLNLNKQSFTPGDQFVLTMNLQNNTSSRRNADIYLALNFLENYWFWPGWSMDIDFMNRYLSACSDVNLAILNFIWPWGAGSASNLKFMGGIVDYETQELLAYDEVEFSYTE